MSDNEYSGGERVLLESHRRYIGILITVVMLILVCNFGTTSISSLAADAGSEETETLVMSEKQEEVVLPVAGFCSEEDCQCYNQPSIAIYDELCEASDIADGDDRSDEDTKSDEDETEEESPATFSKEEYLALLIESEAGNVKSFDGRVAVALTALKRVEAKNYPNTIVEVVEQPHQYTDLVGYYSEKSYDAAVKAIALWEEGADETVLPDGYIYFFGYNQQNWFYRYKSDGSIEFYTLPGQVIDDGVWQAFREIVLKETPAEEASEEVQEAIGETLDETVTEEALDTSEATSL